MRYVQAFHQGLHRVKFATSKLPYELRHWDQKGGLTDLQTRLEHYTCPRLVSQSVGFVKKPKDGMGGRTDKPASDFSRSSS